MKTRQAVLSMPGKKISIPKPKSLKQIPKLKGPWGLFMFNTDRRRSLPGSSSEKRQTSWARQRCSPRPQESQRKSEET